MQYSPYRQHCSHLCRVEWYLGLVVALSDGGGHEVERDLQLRTRSQNNGLIIAPLQGEVICVWYGRYQFQALIRGIVQSDVLTDPPETGEKIKLIIINYGMKEKRKISNKTFPPKSQQVFTIKMRFQLPSTHFITLQIQVLNNKRNWTMVTWFWSTNHSSCRSF